MDGPIILLMEANNIPESRSNVSASIDENMLYVSVTTDSGIADIEVYGMSGSVIAADEIYPTPGSWQYNIPLAGYYNLVISLGNGDVYTRNFVVN